MSAGRVRHWKHGWIPISPEAKAFAAGKGPRPLTTTLERPKTQEAKLEWRGNVSDARKKEVQGIVDSYLVDRFPGATHGEALPIEVVPNSAFDNPDPDSTVWADTDMQKSTGHLIRLNERMWDDSLVESALFNGEGATVTTQADNPADFRRLALQHELGHYINARTREDSGGDDGYASGKPVGPLDHLANTLTTPWAHGYREVPPGTDPAVLHNKVPRFLVDNLDNQSQYAVSGSPDEWIAEALLEGVMHGDNATSSGKKALAIATKMYGAKP